MSAAYYALFHRLTDAGSRFLVRGEDRGALRLAVTRAFDHGEMKSAAQSFVGGTLPAAMRRVAIAPIPPDLTRICVAFIDLQQARHEADYDLTRTFSRREVEDLVARAEQAVRDWSSVAGTPHGDAFLVALLLRKRMQR